MPTQWSNVSDQTFTPAEDTVLRLPSGAYEASQDRYGHLLMVGQSLKSESLLIFDDAPTKWLMTEIEKFWESEHLYTKMGLAWKRGILMHGLPGTGKSGIIQLASRQVIKNGGIVVSSNHIPILRNAMANLKILEPKTPLVVVLEDLEELLEVDEHGLLQLLDGIGEVKTGVLYLSTTNNIKKIPDRIKNRPSRFDTVIQVDPPLVKARGEYLIHVLKNMRVKPNVLKQMIARSNGYTFAHLKELAIAVAIYGRSVDAATKTINQMGTQQDNKKDEDSDGPEYATSAPGKPSGEYEPIGVN